MESFYVFMWECSIISFEFERITLTVLVRRLEGNQTAVRRPV